MKKGAFDPPRFTILAETQGKMPHFAAKMPFISTKVPCVCPQKARFGGRQGENVRLKCKNVFKSRAQSSNFRAQSSSFRAQVS